MSKCHMPIEKKKPPHCLGIYYLKITFVGFGCLIPIQSNSVFDACMCIFWVNSKAKQNSNPLKSQNIFNIVKRIQITIPSKANRPNETQLKSVFVSSNKSKY